VARRLAIQNETFRYFRQSDQTIPVSFHILSVHYSLIVLPIEVISTEFLTKLLNRNYNRN
jgi:hypothetical protein